MDHQIIYLYAAILFGFLMSCGIGANDVSNAMGTSVGSKAITVRQAIWIAGIFEFIGALLAGGEVTTTIQSKIIYSGAFVDSVYSLGMLSSLIAAATWLLLASYYRWPVSTTHTIIGSIVGFGIFQAGFSVVFWNKIFYLVLSWILSPVLGLVLSYSLFFSLQKLIFSRKDPIEASKKVVPFYICFTVFMISMMTIRQLEIIKISLIEAGIFALLTGLLAAFLGRFLIGKMVLDPNSDKDFHYTNVEKIFSVLMIFTACAMAFAHGSNDVANAIGPVSAIVQSSSKTEIPIFYILLLGGVGIVVGLAVYGYKVMATIGSGITQLTPSRGFSVTLAAAFTVVLASATGIPVSTTHTLVGGILGVGLARGIGAINLKAIKSIFTSWLITLPAGATLSILYFVIFSYLMKFI